MKGTSSETANKKQERPVLDKFIDLYSEFPNGSIVDSEAPDFIVGNVGIELTCYMRDPASEGGSTVRKSEDVRNQILALAEKNFNEICNTPYYVRLFWLDTVQFDSLHGRDIKKLAIELARFLVALTNNGTLMEIDAEWPELSNTPLERVIAHISATAIPTVIPLSGHEHFWTSMDAVWADISYEPLKQCIAAKEPKLSEYEKKCEHIWLLIYAEGTGPSSIARLSPHIPPETIATNFDRAFFFELRSHRIHVLAQNR